MKCATNFSVSGNFQLLKVVHVAAAVVAVYV